MACNMDNPWLAKNWEEFLYFCCPECPEKYQSKELFIDHALQMHPNAQVCLETVQIAVKYEEKDVEEEGRKLAEKLAGKIGNNKTFIVLSRPKRNSKPNPKYLDDYEYETNSKSKDPLTFDDPAECPTNDEKHNLQSEIKIEDDLEELIQNETINYDEIEADDTQTIQKAVVGKSKVKVKTRKKDGAKTNDKELTSDQKYWKEKNSKRIPKDCPICGKTIKTKLNLHILLVHESEKIELLECDTCGKKFKLKSSLDRHKRERCGKENIDEDGQETKKRNKCPKSYTRVVYEGEENYVCPICGKYFKVKHSYRNLTRHIETVHEGKVPISQCTICGNTFRSSSYLGIHMRAIHDKIRKWKCEHCPMDFAHKQSWIDHVARIHEGVKWECDLCPGHPGFSLERHLKKHRYRKHEDTINELSKDQGTTFPCKVCQKVLFSAELLKYHLIIRHKASKEVFISKDFPNELIECDSCGTKFQLQSSLNRHKEQAHGPKKHICNLCGKASSTAYDLKLHLKTVHDQSNRTPCPTCGKLIRPDTLKYHIQRIHEEINKNRHICQECGKSCAEASTLKAHLAAIHSIGIQHNCPHCGKPFGSKYNLKIHISGVHEGKRFECDYCTSSFTQSQDIKKHCQKVHPDKKFIRKQPTLKSS